MKNLLSTIIALSIFTAIAAEQNANADKTVLPQTFELKKSADFGVMIYQNVRDVVAKKLVKINPDRLYKLSFDYKRATPGKEIVLWVGFRSYDKNKRRIQPREVRYVKNSETELIVPCEPGSKKMLIRNGSKWNPKIPTFIAFNVKNNYADLPNTDCHRTGKISVVKKDGFYELNFTRQLKKGYPTGTKIRQHFNGPDIRKYMTSPGMKWQKGLMTIDGIDDGSNIMRSNKYWLPGSAYFKIFIWTSAKNKDDSVLLKNIKYEILPKPENEELF